MNVVKWSHLVRFRKTSESHRSTHRKVNPGVLEESPAYDPPSHPYRPLNSDSSCALYYHARGEPPGIFLKHGSARPLTRLLLLSENGLHWAKVNMQDGFCWCFFHSCNGALSRKQTEKYKRAFRGSRWTISEGKTDTSFNIERVFRPTKEHLV